VARHVDINGNRSRGKQQLRGVEREIEVYALAV